VGTAKLDEEDKRVLKQGSENEKAGTDARARCWEVLVMQYDNGVERAVKRMDLIMNLRKAMKDYGMSMLTRLLFYSSMMLLMIFT
jgi:hypothetical protein